MADTYVQDQRMKCLEIAVRLKDKNAMKTNEREHECDETLRLADTLHRYVRDGNRRLTWHETYESEQLTKARAEAAEEPVAT